VPSFRPRIATDFTVLGGVVVLSVGVIVAMFIVLFCALSYPGDHITCESFLAFFLCYSPTGAKMSKIDKNAA
jgi:hypothetical protein